MSVNLYKPKVMEFETEGSFLGHVSDYITDQIMETEAELGLVRLLFSGGQTPFPIYKKLASSTLLPWQSIEIYQSDERFVPSSHNHSNQKKLLEALDKVRDRCKQINVFNTNLSSNLVIKDYEEKLDSLDGVWFDLAVLGIGNDGHIASLFPGGDYFNHQSESVIATQAPEQFESPQRLSLSVPSLLNSQQIMVLLSGKNKKEVLLELLEGNKSAVQFPAKFLLSHPNVRIYCFFSEV